MKNNISRVNPLVWKKYGTQAGSASYSDIASFIYNLPTTPLNSFLLFCVKKEKYILKTFTINDRFAAPMSRRVIHVWSHMFLYFPRPGESDIGVEYYTPWALTGAVNTTSIQVSHLPPFLPCPLLPFLTKPVFFWQLLHENKLALDSVVLHSLYVST